MECGGDGEEGMRTPAVFTQHHWGFRAIHGTQTLSDSEILLSVWAAFLTKITTLEGLLLGHGFVRITNYTVKPRPGQAWAAVTLSLSPALEAPHDLSLPSVHGSCVWDPGEEGHLRLVPQADEGGHSPCSRFPAAGAGEPLSLSL